MLETLVASVESSVAWSDGDRLRRDLARWQTETTTDAMQRSRWVEVKLDEISRTLVEIVTTQALQGQDINRLKADSDDIRQRLGTLERMGNTPDPVFPRPVLVGAGLILIVMLALIILLTVYLI